MIKCPKDKTHDQFYRRERVVSVETRYYDKEGDCVDIDHEQTLDMTPWDVPDHYYCSECDTPAEEVEG